MTAFETPTTRRERSGHGPVEQQNESLRQTIAVVDRLTAIALEGAGIERIATELASSLDAQVLVFDELFGPLAEGSPRGGPGPLIAAAEDPRVREMVETVRDKRLPVRLRALPGSGVQRDCVIAPVASGERVVGFLVATTGQNGRDEDLQLMTIQHATSILALAFVQTERDEELRLRYRAEFVESLLSAAPQGQKAIEFARLAGLTPSVAYEAIAIAPADPEAGYEQLFNRIAQELNRLGAGYAAVARTDHVVVLAPIAEGANAGAAEARVAEAVRRAAPHVAAVVLGSSRAVVDRGELGRADVQARRALGVARRLRLVGEVTQHDRLGVHRLLLHVPLDELTAFAHEVLGGVLARESDGENTLLVTLSTYLSGDANVRSTAAELFVHPNTVSYRLRRIEELSGLTLRSARDRMLASIALEALRALPE